MKKRIYSAILLAFVVSYSGLAGGLNSQPTGLGKILSFEQKKPDNYSVTFNCENGRVRLSFLKSDIIRVHMAPAGKEFPKDDLHLDKGGPYAVIKYDWSPGAVYQFAETQSSYKINAGEFVTVIDKNPFRLHFFNRSGDCILEESEKTGLSFFADTVKAVMNSASNEHFVGGGAYKHFLDMKGSKLVCEPSELGEMDRGGGFPVPWFMSSRGYGLFFNNLSPDATLDFRNEATYSFYAKSGAKEGWDMDFYLFYGPKIEKIIKGYIEVVGKPCLPEKWYFGYMQSECCGGDPNVKNIWADKYRSNRWPCDVFIEDLQGFKQNMDWNRPGYPEMLKNIHAQGFKFGISLPLFRNWWEWKDWDPTDINQRKAYTDTLKKRIPDGIDFIWMDNSERADYWTKKKELNGYPTNSLYGSLWSTANIKAFEDLGLYGRPSISRGGPVGGHRYNVVWPGDIHIGFERLDTDLDWFRNSGLSAYVATTVDLSGFWFEEGGDNKIDVTGIWNPATGKFSTNEHVNRIRRFIDVLMVYPIARMHGGCMSEPDNCFATKPWFLSENEEKLFRHYLNLRYRLFPYIYSAAIEGHLTGRPILGSLVWDYQNDDQTFKQDYEFMFGRNMLVAPVICKEKVYKTPIDEWSVYLPANSGKWVHYWSGQKYDAGTGTTITVKAPLEGKDGLPLFIREGAIIPMMPQMQYIYEVAPEPVTLEIFPKPNNTSDYTLYDCDKGSRLLPFPQLDSYSSTLIKCEDNKSEIRLSIGKSQNIYEIVLHLDKKPLKIMADGMTIKEVDNQGTYKSVTEGSFFGPDLIRGTDFSIPAVHIKYTMKKGEKHEIIVIK